jgi:predicted O-methyltransferase YrrM
MMDELFLQAVQRWNPIPPLFLGVPTDERLANTLARMEEDKLSPGRSDTGIRNMLFSLVICTRPNRILEIGGHIGMATIVLARGCQLSDFGHVVTIEPHDQYHPAMVGYIDAAGLGNFVTILKGFSYDAGIIARIRAEGPYQLVYIDALHGYQAVMAELEFVSSVLSKNGFIVLHDTSVEATEYDPDKMGGVRRAVREFCASHGEFNPIFFEPPLWLNPTGMAMVCRQNMEHIPQEHNEKDSESPVLVGEPPPLEDALHSAYSAARDKLVEIDDSVLAGARDRTASCFASQQLAPASNTNAAQNPGEFRSTRTPPRTMTLSSLANIRDHPNLCELLRECVLETYYAGLPREEFSGEEGQKKLDYDAIDRLSNAARWVVPWVQARVDLSNVTVIDFGCGTGSSTAAFALAAHEVIGYEIHEASVLAARRRFEILGITNAVVHLVDPDFAMVPTPDAASDFASAHPEGCEVIVLFAVAEHLTQGERIPYLRTFWNALQPGGLLVVVDTPNRLCMWDFHTSFLPFFHLLPEEIAAHYYTRSPRNDFVEAVRTSLSKAPEDFVTTLHRWGSGLSFHEFEIAFEQGLNGLILCNGYEYEIINWFVPNTEERMLVSYFLDREIKQDIGFARTVLNFVFQKPGLDGSKLPPVELPPEWCQTFIPWHHLDERLFGVLSSSSQINDERR